MDHGKSTLFKSLCKQLKIKSGNIIIDENSISSFNNKQFANKAGVLFQENISPNINVKQLVSYGRFSHIGIFSNLNNNDYEIINKALKITGTKKFENLHVNELSSGQRQLVWIALLVAQDVKYLFLDEPTTYLDLKHQYEILDCLVKLNKEENKTIVMILHDINQAIQYADNIIVMKDGKIIKSGVPKKIITSKLVKDVFEINANIIKNKGHIYICPLKNI